MIGTRCNRKPSGLKGADAVKDHVAEKAITNSQSAKKPKDDLIFTREGRCNAGSDKHFHFPKDGLPRMFDTLTGTGRKWDRLQQIQ